MAGKIRNWKIIGLALCMAVLFCVPAFAASEPTFFLHMDSLNLQKGVSTEIVISVVNGQGARLINIKGIENFEVLSTSQSTSTSVVNGVATYQTDVYYTVMPRTTGQFTLKVNLQYDGRSYATNELQVTISDEPANSGERSPDLFIKTVLSHTEAYLGEKIVVTYELYSRYNVESSAFTDYVAIDGMLVKDMPSDKLKAEYVYLDGNKYAKYEVLQMILDPIKSGVYTIPSYNFQANITSNSGMNGPFSAMLNLSKPMYLLTEEKELTVKPLPSEGKPKDFSGIVGELQLDGYYSRESMKYGDSFTLQAAASGSFSPDGLKNIVIGEIPGFTLYQTQKNTEESVINSQYHVQKAFEVIFVPEKTGFLDVAPISISYFNPVTEKYERAELPGVTVEVTGDMPQSYGFSGGPVESVRIDQVSYADASNGYFSIQLKKDVVYGVLIGLIVLLVLAAVLIWLISNRKKHDPALKSLYKQLMAAKDINEIYNIFNAMIKHCYKLSLKASSQNTILSSLPDAGLAAQVTDIMDYMESDKAREEQAPVYLKDKIKGVYRMILLH